MTKSDHRDVERPLVGGSVGRRARFAQKVAVPVGLEKLLYLAARDPDLRERLLADRPGAIAEIGVALRSSEKAMLEAAPRGALEAMIDRIDVSNPRKRRFMNLVAAAATSLAAGTALPACDTVEHDAVSNMDAGGDGPDVDTDTDEDAGSDTETESDSDTDTETVDTDTNYGVDAGVGPDVDADSDVDASDAEGGN